MPKIGQRYAKGIVKSSSNLKNMMDLLTDSPTGIQENTIRDGGSTGLYTVFTVYTIQTALHCLKIACMPMRIYIKICMISMRFHADIHLYKRINVQIFSKYA